ncbi:protein kinase domain-containing protein [Rubripirellula reticaptiva]|uniref:Serine/threonine-protein kinase PknD n=1 Tax=Rubripirellula reticaptiva TaxID=2528013 RepID=A0A5C6EKU7_9BACT|nr:protein kinase [Rubripirellula reticaptiva]TWU48191.1 Serine/threonine-protein kinase PknD [Rubripirellula reticaptiva]
MVLQPSDPKPGANDFGHSGLLASILGSASLRKQLSAMPFDEKTIELSTTNLNDLSHPDWTSTSGKNFQHETIDVSIDQTLDTAPPVDLGFIPKRVIANIGTPSTENTDYRIIGKLGAGGTAVVFQAHQRAVDREVAVKMLHEELSSKAASRERFLAEARVIGGLDHPNIIALHEVYSDASGGLFYSMKCIDGTSWDKQIADLSHEQNMDTLLRVADGIRYAHSRGLIHRDIKPENVMLGRFGEVLLADWGLAIKYGSSDQALVANSSIGGTPAYMAPELASASAGEINFQTDVYLLGAILFQIQTGRPPHYGETLLECLRAAASNVIETTEVEGELMDIAMTAMATKQSDRYPDVDAFVAAIKDQRQHEQSVRLVRRAVRQVAQPKNAVDVIDPYKDYGIADALLGEAIETWPENPRAHEVRKRLQLEFARIATERGDFDLATNIYEAAGESESDEALMVKFHRMRRDASQQAVSRYSALFTQSPDAGLLVQMSTGKIVEANLAFGRLLGYKADQVVGVSIGELNLWVCPKRRTLMIDRVKQHGSVDDFEAQFYHTDGRIIDVLFGARVLEVEGEQMLLSTLRDISLRKIAENELKRSRARLRDLQGMAGLATWSYDVITGKVTWNTEAFELAGRSREEGTPTQAEYFEMIHPEDRGRLRMALDMAIDSGAAYELSVRQKSMGGEFRYVVVRGQPILDDDGKTVEVYGVVLERPQRSVERD